MSYFDRYQRIVSVKLRSLVEALISDTHPFYVLLIFLFLLSFLSGFMLSGYSLIYPTITILITIGLYYETMRMPDFGEFEIRLKRADEHYKNSNYKESSRCYNLLLKSIQKAKQESIVKGDYHPARWKHYRERILIRKIKESDIKMGPYDERSNPTGYQADLFIAFFGYQWTLILENLFGYGYKLERWVLWCFWILFFYSTIYSSFGILKEEGHFLDYFNLSGRAFTTLGYSKEELNPEKPLLQILPIIEAGSGAFMIAGLVLIFGRKVSSP